MDDLNLELSSDPDNDNNNNQISPSTCFESVEDIDSSDFEEADESDNVDVEASAGYRHHLSSSVQVELTLTLLPCSARDNRESQRPEHF